LKRARAELAPTIFPLDGRLHQVFARATEAQSRGMKIAGP
jgi:hypothetical protein